MSPKILLKISSAIIVLLNADLGKCQLQMNGSRWSAEPCVREWDISKVGSESCVKGEGGALWGKVNFEGGR